VGFFGFSSIFFATSLCGTAMSGGRGLRTDARVSARDAFLRSCYALGWRDRTEQTGSIVCAETGVADDELVSVLPPPAIVRDDVLVVECIEFLDA
jgi:hypothetical protein